MPNTLPEQNLWTLEELAAQYGPIEIQRPLSTQEFTQLTERYPNLSMEREPNGTVTLMSPVKKGSSRRESRLAFLLCLWNENAGHGEVYSANGTYLLPDGAIKMPDASWISPERLAETTEEDEEAFIQTLPDFVVEIRSKSDPLKKLQQKMTDTWMANGIRLAWLIDPYEEKVYVYKQGQDVRVVSDFATNALSGDDVLPGFELPLVEMMRKP